VSRTPEDPHPVTPGPLIRVEDPDDPQLDHYRDLNDPAGRVRLDAAHSVFVVEGALAVGRLLTSGYTVRSLLVDDRRMTAVGDLIAGTRAQGAPVFVGSRAVVAGTVGFDLHRGVVAVANRPSPVEPTSLLAEAVEATKGRGPPPLIAVLEGLNDHENIGALFRNAAAFGVAGVVLDPTCADPLYRRSIRVSVGHVLHMPYARLTSWPSGLQQMRSAGFMIAALAPRPSPDGAVPSIGLAELRARMNEGDHPSGVALLLGAEGAGVTEAALASSDVVVTIPMAEGVDSLNVATAAAIAFHALTGV